MSGYYFNDPLDYNAPINYNGVKPVVVIFGGGKSRPEQPIRTRVRYEKIELPRLIRDDEELLELLALEDE